MEADVLPSPRGVTVVKGGAEQTVPVADGRRVAIIRLT
jgi:hypothetical protein